MSGCIYMALGCRKENLDLVQILVNKDYKVIEEMSFFAFLNSMFI